MRNQGRKKGRTTRIKHKERKTGKEGPSAPSTQIKITREIENLRVRRILGHNNERETEREKQRENRGRTGKRRAPVSKMSWPRS